MTDRVITDSNGATLTIGQLSPSPTRRPGTALVVGSDMTGGIDRQML